MSRLAVFDLRVEESYQRKGIGRAITAEAEAQAEARGVTFLYLSVNNDNRKARALYQSMGWVPGSRRALIFRPLLRVPAAPTSAVQLAQAGGGVQQLSTAEALAITAAYFSKRDLGLSRSEFQSVFASPLLIGTFAASDGRGSRAVLSLWHGSSFNSFRPVRFLLPLSVWASLSLPLAATALALSSYTAQEMIRMARGPIARTLIGAACTAAAVTLGFIANFIRTRKHFRARAFAPVVEGPNWQPLMQCVHARVLAEARDLGFGVIVINEDVGSPFAAAMRPVARDGQPTQKSAKPRAATSFLQKALPAAAGAGAPLAALMSDAFFDPRDI